MAKAPAGFDEFVDARGLVLARTASLLELDEEIAQDAVVAALAKAARRWRALARDGNAETKVRHQLHEQVIGRWRREGLLDDIPDPSTVDADATIERQALATLSNRQRALVVLVAYESLSTTEAADLLRCSADAVARDQRAADAQLRTALGITDSASLLPLLNAAASRKTPDGLAQRAHAASRSGGRRGYLAAAVAIASAVAVVAAATALAPGADDDPVDPVAANVDRWGIPTELPLARGLPSLAQKPTETASMAYVAQGTPVVVDAEMGAARTVLAGKPQPAWYDGDIGGVKTGLLRKGPPWTQAVLSPDGAWLLLVQAPLLVGRAASGILDSRNERTIIDPPPGPTGDLYLVRIRTGEVTPVPDARPVASAQGVASVADTNLAWAPGGGAFACVCRGRISVYDLEPTAPRVTLLSASTIAVTDVAWGAEGLIARRTDGGWFSRSDGGSAVGRMGTADAAAASIISPPVYLSVGVTSTYALGADTAPDGGRCVLWDADFTLPVEITPVPDRDGDLCTPIALQPGRAGVLLTLSPDDQNPEPLPIDVVSVDASGASSVIATLPAGTTTASYAASLVG
ncbi:MAG: hypothetical protein LH630_10565 [Actinomycetia bacterium]|nr:hypothetical protein [Actinomycetes bacterium]